MKRKRKRVFITSLTCHMIPVVLSHSTSRGTTEVVASHDSGLKIPTLLCVVCAHICLCVCVCSCVCLSICIAPSLLVCSFLPSYYAGWCDKIQGKTIPVGE